MPYQNSQIAIENSENYKIYYTQEIERKRLEILQNKTDYLTNPKFGTTLTRDNRGFLVSFPNPLDYKKDDSQLYELVTIPLNRRIFISQNVKKMNTEFEAF